MPVAPRVPAVPRKVPVAPQAPVVQSGKERRKSSKGKGGIPFGPEGAEEASSATARQLAPSYSEQPEVDGAAAHQIASRSSERAEVISATSPHFELTSSSTPKPRFDLRGFGDGGVEIVTQVGRLQASIRAFERSCEVRGVPQYAYSEALMQSLSASQYSDLPHPVLNERTGVKETRSFSDLTYAQMIQCLTAAYDSTSARQMALQKFHELTRTTGTSPEVWGRQVVAAAYDADCSDNQQIVRMKFVHGLPLSCRQDVNGMHDTWDMVNTKLPKVVAVAQQKWQAAPEHERELRFLTECPLSQMNASSKTSVRGTVLRAALTSQSRTQVTPTNSTAKRAR